MEEDIRLRKHEIQVGQFLKLSRRVSDRVNAKAEAGHEVRTYVGDRLVEVSPNFDNENFNKGTITGAFVSAIAAVVNEYVPIAADTEIVDSEPVQDGTRYTVNVDSPLESQARFRAMLESGTGWTSYLTDEFDMEDPQAIHKRPARDTWQVEVTVKEPDTAAKTLIEKGVDRLRDRRKLI